MKPLVICGGGMAAMRLVKELKAVEFDDPIVVVCEEAMFGYNRVLLPDFLAGKRSLEELRVEQEISGHQKLSVLTELVGVELDVRNKTLRLSDGSILEYGRLVLATGASAKFPSIPGIDLDGVGTLRCISDAQYLSGVRDKNTAIVGGGLLGLEAAAALSERGHKVTVVHRNTQLLNKQIDAAAASKLQAELESLGIKFCLKAEVSSIEGGTSAKALTLSNGESMEVDNVLFATGSVPNSKLGRDDLRIEAGAYTADAQLRTSIESVYALGECAVVNGNRSALVGTLNEQARVLANNLLGSTDEFVKPVESTRLKVGTVELVVAGSLADNAKNDVLMNGSGIYRRFSYEGKTLKGVVLFGDTRGAAGISAAVGKTYATPSERLALASGS